MRAVKTHTGKGSFIKVNGGAAARQPAGLIPNPTDHHQRCHNIAIWLIWSGFASALGVSRLLGKDEIRSASDDLRKSRLKPRANWRHR